MRVLLFMMIVMSFFYIANLNPIDITAFFGASFGQAIGVAASVPENPFNQLALQLKEKEDNLANREKAVSEREAALNGSGQAWWFVGLGIGIGALFILLSFNFYFDYRRDRRYRKEKREGKKVKDGTEQGKISGNNNQDTRYNNQTNPNDRLPNDQTV